MATVEDITAAIATNTERPPSKLNDLIIVVYGDKKVGKSTFASRFENPLFLDCEDALRTVQLPDGTRPKQVSINAWDDGTPNSLAYWADVDPSALQQLGIKTLVVDGLGQAYKRLVESVLRDNNVDDINEGSLAYGKGGRKIRSELEAWFFKLRKLTYHGIGVVLTAHERTLSFEHNGANFDKRVPLIDGEKDEKAWTVIKPSVDMIIHASKIQTAEGVAHVMRLKGNQLVEAADPTPDGRLPETHVFSQIELARLYAGEESE